MLRASYQSLYFDWLMRFVYDDYHDLDYEPLCECLNSIEFYYTIQNDANRVSDAHALRYRFAYETGISYEDIDDAIRSSVSVFEVMIAMALRGEESIMRDFDIGDRTSLWFWTMIDSMHLSDQNYNFNEDTIRSRVNSMLSRNYNSNGDGGLFTVNNPPYDMRKAELWYQMNWYFNTIT